MMQENISETFIQWKAVEELTNLRCLELAVDLAKEAVCSIDKEFTTKSIQDFVKQNYQMFNNLLKGKVKSKRKGGKT